MILGVFKKCFVGEPRDPKRHDDLIERGALLGGRRFERFYYLFGRLRRSSKTPFIACVIEQ